MIYIPQNPAETMKKKSHHFKFTIKEFGKVAKDKINLQRSIAFTCYTSDN